MKNNICLLIFFILQINLSFSQTNISGRVFSPNGEAIIGAVVTIDSNNSVLTDNFGYFVIMAKSHSIRLKIESLGYKTRILNLNTVHDTNLTIYLIPATYEIEQIEITAKKSFVDRENYSVLNIPLKTMKKLAYVFGEKDIFKSIQGLPGIQPGLEASSQVNIRGGNPFQNSVLLDGMPVFNSSHIFGFLSIFNMDAIKDMKLYKGAIPPYFTNLSSGVIDLKMKDGSLTDQNLAIEQSIFSTKLSYNGYIIKNRLSSSFFYRHSLITYLLKGISAFVGMPSGIKTLGFEDVNAKLRWKINKNNTLYYSFFNTRDNYTFQTSQDFFSPALNTTINNRYNDELVYNNFIFSIRLFSVLSSKLTAENILGYSNYRYAKYKQYLFSLKENPDSILNYQNYNYDNNIYSIILRSKFRYFFTNNFFMFLGFNLSNQVTDYTFNNKIYYYLDTMRENVVHSKRLNILFSPYFYFSLKNKYFGLNIGGVNDFFINEDTNFIYFSPRISFKLMPKSEISLQFSYSKLYQQNHLITTSSVSNPADIILPSSSYIKPVKSELYDFSIIFNKIKNYNFSFSGYYKTMENLTRFKLGVNLITLNEDLTNYVALGKGYSYGLEFSIVKNSGKLHGWLSYTYSRSFRLFPQINLGKVFPYKYDRPHIFNISVIYDLKTSGQLSLSWFYYSGHNITLPTQIYIAGFSQFALNQYIEYYQSVNNIRTPPYHRLDIAFNYHKKGKHSYWSVGIYNIYNRLNPVYLYPENGTTLKGICLFPIMPFFSYRYELSW